jgi:hypothetical protein
MRLSPISTRFDKYELEDTTLKEDLKANNAKRKKVMQLIKIEEEKQGGIRWKYEYISVYPNLTCSCVKD